MKKKALLILAIAFIAMPACKNQTKKTEENTDAVELSTKEQIAAETLNADVQNIIESAKKIKPAPFASASKDGRINLTAREKRVKPDYLLPTAKANDLVTFSQKYRAVSMYAVDLAIADLYEMPTTEYKNTVATLLTDLGDDAFTIFAQTPWIDLETAEDAMKDLAEDEYKAGRQNFYWESVASSLVEQVFVITRNIDKFLPMFNDESASDFTYNFVCLHESLLTVVDMNPEMQSLNEILAPLYVINAISVSQLKEQLTSLKEPIVDIRAALLK